VTADNKTSAADNAAAAARRRAKKREGGNVTPQSLARLAAVQALYQIELMELDASTVINEFCTYHLGPVASQDGEEDVTAHPDPDVPDMQGADQDHFRAIVTAASEQAVALDGLIRQHLADGWTIERLDANMRALLRAACGTWMANPEVPAKSVLEDFLDIADAFFDGNDLRFSSGVLNALSRRVAASQTSD